MMKNDPQRPDIARKSQDVGPTPRRNSEGATHTGRGINTTALMPKQLVELRSKQVEIC